MTTVILIGLVAVCLGVVFFLGYRLAKVSKEREAALTLSRLRHRAINAMTLAIAKEATLRETFVKINNATDADTLNQLYKDILSSSRNS